MTLCILNCRLVSFAGREKTGLVLSSLESVGMCSRIPARMVCPEMFIWESRDFVSKERGTAGKLCLTAVCGQASSERYCVPGGLARNGGWPAQSVCFVRRPLSCWPHRDFIPVFLLSC